MNPPAPDPTRYVGRFAPSPTGPLHLGSLFTAIASYLDARANAGVWLLRIDDLDTPRCLPGAADAIFRTLNCFGLHWDQTVTYQSQHQAQYMAAIDTLAEQNLLYRCICSRKRLGELSPPNSNIESPYPNYCRDQQFVGSTAFALRLKTTPVSIQFNDLIQGRYAENLATQHGDFIVQRKDGIIAYQLAVAIDDHLQDITHIVRGADLLSATIKQIYVHHCLHLPLPHYAHVPVITGRQGEKLSKRDFAPAVNQQNSPKTLFKLLELLQQQPPKALCGEPVRTLLDWAIRHWNPAALMHQRAIAVDATITDCTND